MFNFNFEDSIKSKYEITGEFHEGLALVSNSEELFGYIDN